MHQGRLVTREGRTLLFLTGSAYEMGFQQGMLLRESIREYADTFWRAYGREVGRWPRWRSTWCARQNLKYLREEERAELLGIAEGADVPLQQVLQLNCGDALMTAARGASSTGTQFAVWGKISADGNLIHARNIDGISCGVAHRFIILAFHKPAQGYMFVTPQLAGSIAPMMALNEKGITVSTSPAFSRDASGRGVPFALLARKVAMQTASLTEAIDLIEAAPRLQTPGFQMMISDGKTNECVLVEMSAHRFSIVHPRRDFQIGANHFQSEGMRSLQKQPMLSSTLRAQRAEQLIEASFGGFTVDTAKAVLRDHLDLKARRDQGSPFTICCHDAARTRFPGRKHPETTSLCGVVVDSSRLTLYAAFGKTHGPHAEFGAYPLRDSWKQRRVPRVIPFSPEGDAGSIS